MIIRIGKAEDNDFIVNDPHVSRHHARLVCEDGGNLLLEDTGSTNGTFVNGGQIVKKRVTPTTPGKANGKDWNSLVLN